MASAYLRLLKRDNEEDFKSAIKMMKRNHYYKKNKYNETHNSNKEEAWTMYNTINNSKPKKIREYENKVDFIELNTQQPKINQNIIKDAIHIHNKTLCQELINKRNLVLNYIYHIYNEHFDHNLTLKKWSINTEKGIYNATIMTCKRESIVANWDHKSFRTRYMNIAKKVTSNLHRTPNAPKVREWLKTKHIKPENLAFMTPDELHPEYAAEKYQRWREKIDFKLNLDDCADGMYQCGKCKKWKTTFTEMQTRSADEPMTVFLTCLTCHNRWRM